MPVDATIGPALLLAAAFIPALWRDHYYYYSYNKTVLRYCGRSTGHRTILAEGGGGAYELLLTRGAAVRCTGRYARGIADKTRGALLRQYSLSNTRKFF